MTPLVTDRLTGARAPLRERIREERARLATLANIEPVRVEDWTPYVSGGANLVRELDLAELTAVRWAPRPGDERRTLIWDISEL